MAAGLTQKLTLAFALAATGAGGVYVGARFFSREAPAPQVTPAATANAQPFAQPIEATVTRTLGDSAAEVRAHVWVAQFAMASVCIKDKPAPADACDYVADMRDTSGAKLSNVAQGQAVVLHSLTPLAHAPRNITPAIELARPRQDKLQRAVRAQIIKVVDGDTVQVRAEIWPNQYVITDIRIGGIDTPEKGGRAGCPQEAARAKEASALSGRMLDNKTVEVSNLQFEKYGGRLLGDVAVGGRDVAQTLIAQGYAKPYDGGKKSSWCAL